MRGHAKRNQGSGTKPMKLLSKSWEGPAPTTPRLPPVVTRRPRLPRDAHVSFSTNPVEIYLSMTLTKIEHIEEFHGGVAHLCPATGTPRAAANRRLLKPFFTPPRISPHWIRSNKGISWGIFWVGWFFISPATIIPGAVAVGVGKRVLQGTRPQPRHRLRCLSGHLGVLGARRHPQGTTRAVGQPLDGLLRNLRVRHPRQTLPDVRLLPDHQRLQRDLSRRRPT